VSTRPAAADLPDDPAARANLEKVLASPSTLRAHEDVDWLTRPELCGARLQLELQRAETILAEAGIAGTIVVFGGTRVVERPEAERRLGEAEARAVASPADEEAQRAVGVARRVLAKARYYDEAREFGRLVSLLGRRADDGPARWSLVRSSRRGDRL
jgi:hypothetical protein